MFERLQLKIGLAAQGAPRVKEEEVLPIAQGTDTQTILLDAREESEYELSHIPGAQRATDLAQAKEVIGSDVTAKVICYCSVGWRSAKLTKELSKEGYSNVYNYEGSIFQWASKELPMVSRDGESVSVVHPYSEKWGRLVAQHLHHPSWRSYPVE